MTKFAPSMGICSSRAGHVLDSDKLTASAFVKIHERNVTAALQDCTKALELNPKNIDAYLTASSCKLAQGNFDEAKSFLKRAQSKVPSNHEERAQVIKDRKREVRRMEKKLKHAKQMCSQRCYEEVLTDVESLTEKVFCLEWVWRLKGVALLELDEVSKIDGVIDEARESLRCIPTNASRRCWWFWLLLQKRWWDIKEDVQLIIQAANKLISILESESISSLDISPASGGPIQKRMVWKVVSLEEANHAFDQGKAFLEQESYQEAIDCFTKALEIIRLTGAPPQFWSEILFTRSGVFLDQGSLVESLRDACLALAINPLHAKSYLRVGEIYLDLDYPSGTHTTMNEMKNRCTLRTKNETRRMESLLSNAQQRMKQIVVSDASKFMGIPEDSSPGQIKKAKNKLALKVHPDKVLSLISGKIDWRTENQDEAVRERESKIQGELKEQVESLFKQLNNAAETLLDKSARSKADDDLKTPRRTYEPKHSYSCNGRYCP